MFGDKFIVQSPHQSINAAEVPGYTLMVVRWIEDLQVVVECNLSTDNFSHFMEHPAGHLLCEEVRPYKIHFVVNIIAEFGFSGCLKMSDLPRAKRIYEIY